MTDERLAAADVAPTDASLWPAAKVEMKPIVKLIPYARNSRTHSEEQIAQIAASMREWGWTTPVLVDENDMILAGHGRIMAARVLGLSEVPTMTARGWSDAQKRAYVLADNKLALNAGWDPDLLKLELQGLEQEDFALDLIGFSEGELSLLTFEPDFEPGSLGDQSRLDEKKQAECPSCGHVFTP